MTCPKCNRQVHPWPLERGSRCSPEDWVYCTRNDPPYCFSKVEAEDDNAS